MEDSAWQEEAKWKSRWVRCENNLPKIYQKPKIPKIFLSCVTGATSGQELDVTP